jgi:predicted Zn-dependent protease with MMP-like domain
MEREEFEDVVERAFQALPKKFRDSVENVEIVVEDEPSSNPQLSRFGVRRNEMLLGLYQNIEAVCRTEEQLVEKIYEVLFHEIGHYFGMNEQEIRSAMRDWE